MPLKVAQRIPGRSGPDIHSKTCQKSKSHHISLLRPVYSPPPNGSQTYAGGWLTGKWQQQRFNKRGHTFSFHGSFPPEHPLHQYTFEWYASSATTMDDSMLVIPVLLSTNSRLLYAFAYIHLVPMPHDQEDNYDRYGPSTKRVLLHPVSPRKEYT